MLIGEGRPKLGLLCVAKITDVNALRERANAQLREFPGYVRIEHVALVTALGIGSFAQNENLPQVAGRGIERATRRLSECGHLICASFDQFRIIVTFVDFKDFALIPRSCQQVPLSIECQCIRQVIARTPQSQRRTIGRDFVADQNAKLGDAAPSLRPQHPDARRGCAGAARPSKRS